jgi:hypothetical protein
MAQTNVQRRKGGGCDRFKSAGLRSRLQLMLKDDAGKGGGGRKDARNVLGETLDCCSMSPRTGFFRNACCDTRS